MKNADFISESTLQVARSKQCFFSHDITNKTKVEIMKKRKITWRKVKRDTDIELNLSKRKLYELTREDLK